MIATVIIMAAMAIITVTVVGLVVHDGIRRWMPGGHEVMINADADFLLRFPFGLLQMASSPPERCIICRRRYKPHHQLSLLRLCGHVFHARCILPWLASNRSCPLCRRHVDGYDDMTSTTETTSSGDANHTSSNHSTASTHSPSTDYHDMASSSSEASSENYLSIDTMAATYGSSTDRMASSESSSENHLSIDSMAATYDSSTDHMASSSSVKQPSINTTAATFGCSTEDMASSVASSAPPSRENEIVPEVVPVQAGEGEGYRSSAMEEVGISDSEEMGCSCSPRCRFSFISIGSRKLRGPGRVSGSAQSSHMERSVGPPGCFSRFLNLRSINTNEFRAHGGSTTTHQPNKVRAVSRFFSRCILELRNCCKFFLFVNFDPPFPLETYCHIS